MKEGNDKLTISVSERVKTLFKELCDKEGLKIGKQIELFMVNELKKRGIDVSEKSKDKGSYKAKEERAKEENGEE